MMVKVLGTGCPKCKKLHEAVEDAVRRSGIQGVTIEKVTDIREIMSFGVMMTPALVVDDRVVATGRVPGVDEIVSMLGNG